MIKHSSNNRVLPSNARAVDVARSTLDRLAPVQARKHDSAFRVDGYSGILYHRLPHGMRCRCTDTAGIAAGLLGIDGKADSGLISSLLTGNEFGIRPYGVVTATTQQSHLAMREIVPVGYTTDQLAPIPRTPSIYEMDTDTVGDRIGGTFSDHYSSDPNDPRATTIVESGSGPNGPVAGSEYVEEMMEDGRHTPGGIGMTDASCPVCFGSGFIGGYTVHLGWRRVLVPYESSASLPADATIDFQSRPPSLEGGSCEWSGIVLPSGVVGVDSVRAYMDDKLLPGTEFYVDGERILSNHGIMKWCDGRPHTIRIRTPNGGPFSHVELQFNQSVQSSNFEFPRQTKNSDMSLLERTDPFSVVFSPLIPMVKTQDIIVEMGTGRAFQVKECTAWNDSRVRILGWESTVRPTQPHELYSLLPRRRPIRGLNSVSPVRDNTTGKSRT